MKQKLIDYLDKLGISQHTSNDLVTFSMNQLNFVCKFMPDDPCYIRIMLPRIDNRDVKELRDVIADINRSFKVARIVEIEDKPWIIADSFVYSNENVEILIGRLIRLLTDVIQNYRDKQLVLNNVEDSNNG